MNVLANEDDLWVKAVGTGRLGRAGKNRFMFSSSAVLLTPKILDAIFSLSMMTIMEIREMHKLDLLRVRDLLRLYSGVMGELRRRGITRSENGPSGDYAELLFSLAYGWRLESNSASGHDAVDVGGNRYQIKCRRLVGKNASPQLSALRNLSKRPFDFLAALLLDEDFEVSRGAIIPLDTVMEHANYRQHVNAHILILRESVWSLPGVIDVTPDLRRAQSLL